MNGVQPNSVYIAFMGYWKAFDSVETSPVMQALQNQDITEPYITAVLYAFL